MTFPRGVFESWLRDSGNGLGVNFEYVAEVNQYAFQWFRYIHDELGPVSEERLRALFDEACDRSTRIALDILMREVQAYGLEMVDAQIEVRSSALIEQARSGQFRPIGLDQSCKSGRREQQYRGQHSDPDRSSDAVWAESFCDVLMGTAGTVRAAIPHLVAGGGGTIVATAAYSIRACHPARLPYVTLKSGVAAFTKTIARAYGREGLRANCICPGAIETSGLAAVRERLAQERGVPPEGLLEQMMADEWQMDVALRRPGKPEEVVDLFAFLMSPRAGYLTGAVINIDSGTEF